MTQAEIEEAIFSAEQTLTLMRSREAQAINLLRSAMLATVDAEQALADARALVPDPVPEPTLEPGTITLDPAPALWCVTVAADIQATFTQNGQPVERDAQDLLPAGEYTVTLNREGGAGNETATTAFYLSGHTTLTLNGGTVGIIRDV